MNINVENVPSTHRTFGYVKFEGQIQSDFSSERKALIMLVV